MIGHQAYTKYLDVIFNGINDDAVPKSDIILLIPAQDIVPKSRRAKMITVPKHIQTNFPAKEQTIIRQCKLLTTNG